MYRQKARWPECPACRAKRARRARRARRAGCARAGVAAWTTQGRWRSASPRGRGPAWRATTRAPPDLRSRRLRRTKIGSLTKRETKLLSFYVCLGSWQSRNDISCDWCMLTVYRQQNTLDISKIWSWTLKKRTALIENPSNLHVMRGLRQWSASDFWIWYSQLQKDDTVKITK